jgi:hypothetical protein
VNPVLALALLAAAGLVLARLARPAARGASVLDSLSAAGLPLVLVGLILGPGAGVLSPGTLRALAPAAALAVAWLGAGFGARFERRLLRRIPRAVWTVAALEAAVAFVAVAFGAWVLLRIRPALSAAWTPALPAVLTLGAIAVVSGPNAVALVARARGGSRRLIRALELAAALDTAFGAVAFTLALAWGHPRAPVGGVPLGPVSWLMLAVGSGLLTGMLFLSLTRLRPARDDTGLALLGVLLLGGGAAFAADLSPFTVCAIAAVVMVNLSPARASVRRLLYDWAPPIYAVFLLMVGALLRLPTAWLLVAAPLLALLRIAAKWMGARAVAWTLPRERWSADLGAATVAQGGVALALAWTFEQSFRTAGSGVLTTVAVGVLCAGAAAPALMARALPPGGGR